MDIIIIFGIFLIIIIAIICTFNPTYKIEGLDMDDESLQNLASLYNKGEAIMVKNLKIPPSGGLVGDGRINISGDEYVVLDAKSGVVIEGKPYTKRGSAGNLQARGSITAQGDIVLGDGKTLRGPGRMHIHGPELLYLLNKNGVIIGKEWGGNGNLAVQGNISGPTIASLQNQINERPVITCAGWEGWRRSSGANDNDDFMLLCQGGKLRAINTTPG